MASIYVLEIDGWGDVGPALAITLATATSDGEIVLTTADTPPGTDEIGAMIFVEDIALAVADGYYTLIARTAGTLTIQALPADVTVGAHVVTGLARIEDHNRISDSIPSWVTGSTAQARWHRVLTAVTSSAGQRISPLGGLATVDGLDITHAGINLMLSAVRAPTYRLDDVGAVTLESALIGSATSVDTYSAAPFSGESASAPTGPAQPPWFGTEAIDVRATPSTTVVDGVTVYTTTCVRAVLRTPDRGHTQGTVVYGRIPTPVGQICRTFVYPEGNTSHASRNIGTVGLCEGFSKGNLQSTQVLRIASQLLQPYRRRTTAPKVELSSPAPFEFASGTLPLRIRSRSTSTWGWILFRDTMAVRLQSPPTVDSSVDADIDGFEVWDYTLDTEVNRVGDAPIIRSISDREEWESYAHAHSVGGGLGGVLEDISLMPLVLLGGTFDARVPAYDELSLCHVFFPSTEYPRAENTDTWILTGSRVMKANPVDIILQILTSTGLQLANGAFDRIPAEFGLGIPLSNLDLSTFTDIADRMDVAGVSAGNVTLLASDPPDIAKWMDVFCKVYGLALVTSTTGSLRLVDLAFIDFETSLSLDEGDLWRNPRGEIAPVYEVDAAQAVESISTAFSMPWLEPDQQDVEINTKTGTRGIGETFERVQGETVAIKPTFAPAVDEPGVAAVAARYGQLIWLQAGLVAAFTVDVVTTYAGEVGDWVSATLLNLPNAADDGPLTASLCRIMDRVHESRPTGVAKDTVTVFIYGIEVASPKRDWAPSGVVSSVVSATDFDLSADVYHGPSFDSDAESFTAGQKVDIYDSSWTLRSTTAPGTVGTASGDNITLSVAATDGGGDVTPNVGDKLALSKESDQGAALSGSWMWLSATTPGYEWA